MYKTTVASKTSYDCTTFKESNLPTVSQNTAPAAASPKIGIF